jgi:ribose transport system ATP-binding protein
MIAGRPTAATAAMPALAGTALAVEHLSKTFGSTRALDDVSIAAARGRIHGLVGGNGSGKSTLIKILAGVHRGDPGGIARIGSTVVDCDATTPAVARAAGLRFVHQDPGVFPILTVAENLAIGGAHGFPTTAGRVRWSVLHRRAAAALERFEIAARPTDLLGQLRRAEQTMVAIARALEDEEDNPGGLVLVLDEPTASLPEHEVETLLAAIRRCAADGQTILYVSHRLEEVVALVDDLTVLRDGRVAESRAATGVTTDQLARAIVGRPLERAFGAPRAQGGRRVRLEVRGLSGPPLRDVSFTVARGEIVGVAGLLGSGRTELLQMLFGARPRAGGEVLLDGVPSSPATAAAAMRAGFAFVPEDRARDAAFPDLSVALNLLAARIADFRRHGRLDQRAERRDADASITRFGVRTPSLHAPLSELSGGNQQKVIMARWLARRPSVLLLDEPTQGVDVGARAELYALIREATAAGMATLLVSSDFEELAHVADRVLVLRDGGIRADVAHEDLSAHDLTDLLYQEDRR